MENPVLSTIPVDEEEFELSLPANVIDPRKVERISPEMWVNTSAPTRKFKLIRVGGCRDLHEVIRKSEALGYKPANELWRSVFAERYPTFSKRSIIDGNGIGFAGSIWDGGLCRQFPVLMGTKEGRWEFETFCVGCYEFSGYWRWLVETS